jgi:hypothetical protein
MVNPEMQNMPGMGPMTDSLEFVKKLWGNMGIPGMSQGTGMPGMQMPGGLNIPGMVMPTLSVEDINKRITDLRAVESWLTLNMNMLHGTIHALEVQAATLTALQSMGQSFSATMNAANMAGAQAAPEARQRASAPPVETPQETVQPTSQDELDAANLTAPLVNAAAWWNVLQSQFQQAVSNAMTPEPASSQQAAPAKKASKSRAATGNSGARKRSSR